jgi:multidrug transporter EmrE-like cation transporter
MKTPMISIFLFVIAAVLGAAGQFFYKTGAAKTTGAPLSYLNAWLLAGVVCYVAVMVLFVAAFKKGGALSVLYPIYASTFIWAAIISFIAYGTAIKPANIGGMALLVAGMYLMGK